MVGLQDTSFRVNRMKHLLSNLAIESGSSPHSRRQYSWTTLSGLLSQMIRYISCFFFFFTLTSCQSIHVVECPEFRQRCMVLRETLIDDDIPRRFSSSILQQFPFFPLHMRLACSVISTTVTFLILCPSLRILCRSSVPPRFAT